MRYFLEVSYRGTNYHGWQVQQNAHTLQQELENALIAFQGGILFISHDTYFIDHIGGETVEIK